MLKKLPNSGNKRFVKQQNQFYSVRLQIFEKILNKNYTLYAKIMLNLK